MFSSPEFSRELPIPQYLFYPAIDPLSEKNRELDGGFVMQTLAYYGIDPERTILTQISRFDRLKDPLGVIRAYRIVKRYFDCQLVLAGGGAPDDPEGTAVLKEVQREAGGDPDIHVLELPAWAPLEVNALQRGSTIVIQKSLREEKTGGGLGGGWNSSANHPQAHGFARTFGGRDGLPDPLPAIASRDRGEARGAGLPAREGKLPDH